MLPQQFENSKKQEDNRDWCWGNGLELSDTLPVQSLDTRSYAVKQKNI